MNAVDLEKLLRDGLKLQKVKRLANGWIEAACPFSSRHSGGIDKSPSFGVRIGADRSSHYRCQGCHAKGGLVDLVWRLSPGSPERAAEIFRWAVAHDNALQGTKYLSDVNPTDKSLPPYPSLMPDVPYNAPDGKILSLIPMEAPAPLVLPESDLTSMQSIPPKVVAYLTGPKRKLTLSTIETWEIGWSGRRISIPIRDHEKRLVGISGRRFDEEGRKKKEGDKQPPKYLHSRGFKRDLFLYGEHMVVPGKIGYVVEGFFDVIGLWQSGYMNAVGIFGSSPSEQQIEKMVKFFSSVVVVGDGDKAGREMANKTYQALKARLPARVVELPEGTDPDELTAEEKYDLFGEPSF